MNSDTDLGINRQKRTFKIQKNSNTTTKTAKLMALLGCSRGNPSVCLREPDVQPCTLPGTLHLTHVCVEDAFNGLFGLPCGSVGHC